MGLPRFIIKTIGKGYSNIRLCPVAHKGLIIFYTPHGGFAPAYVLSPLRANCILYSTRGLTPPPMFCRPYGLIISLCISLPFGKATGRRTQFGKHRSAPTGNQRSLIAKRREKANEGWGGAHHNTTLLLTPYRSSLADAAQSESLGVDLLLTKP